MNHAPPNFGDTVHDWQADPAHWQAGALFQPKSLGTILPGQRARRRGGLLVRLALVVIAGGAGAVALTAFARALQISL